MEYNDFEGLLRKESDFHSQREYNKFNNIKEGVFDSKQLKAEKTASLFDFIKMIDRIVTLTMKDLGVRFIPDEGRSLEMTSEQKLETPMITYKVLERKPKVELKPRYREAIETEDEYGDKQIGEVYGQKFKCHIQFNIFASVYTTVEQVMERFEDLMITYAGYFKKNGVSELLFDQQLTDDKYEVARQTLSVRNLRYYVEIEKITVIMRESIKAIETY